MRCPKMERHNKGMSKRQLTHGFKKKKEEKYYKLEFFSSFRYTMLLLASS
jgi:hypothetical protein